MSRSERVAVGVALIVVAALAVVMRAPLTDALAAPGGVGSQRSLAGGTAGVNPRLGKPLRVVVLDGLSRADAPRIRSFEALCGRGVALTVDVGFPTKSLAVQRTLWSGLTARQTGDGYNNDAAAAPPSSLPLLVPSLAVVESHAVIARSVGFTTVLPGADADGADPVAVPDQVRAWERGEFVTSARTAVASEWPLVMVHVLAIDEAAHRGGRRSDDYDLALEAADEALAAVVEAAPGAQWLVLADHGHVTRGGHGDAEDEVRRVIACWAPAPAGVTTGEVHLVDVARWLADSAGAPRDPRAVGRALAVAVAHPDPDATLPRPSWPARIAALVLLVAGVAASLRWRVHRGLAAALATGWPALTAAVVMLGHGVPTLSSPAPFVLLAAATVVPCGAALAYGWRTGAGGRVALAGLSVTVALALGVAILSGVLRAITHGPPARVPYWTGILGAIAVILGVAIATTGGFLLGNEAIAAIRRVRSAGHRRPKRGH